jgi:phosphate-selective porin OprO/OprP
MLLCASAAVCAFVATDASAATKTKKHTKTTTTVAAKPAPDAELLNRIAQQQAQIDALTAKINAMAPPPPPVDLEARAKTAELQTKVDTLNTQLAEAKKGTDNGIITGFNAAPTFAGKGKFSGFTFKPSGEIQFDTGTVSNPGNAITSNSLGFNARARRLLLGASGDVPGDFKYKIEVNFANSTVDFEDVTLTWAPKDKPVSVTAGYFYPYNGLENLISNKNLSVLERSQTVDAFGEGRRLGIGLGYAVGDFRANAGAFAGSINNSNFDNNDYEFSGRLSYTPKAFGGQLQLAGNAQYRQFKRDEQSFRYRARPFTQTTDFRFIDTKSIAATNDAIFGVEALGIFGPFHVQGEAQIDTVNTIDPTKVFVLNSGSTGTRYFSNPTFWGGYIEGGFWLTGETRGFKNGLPDRTKILHPFGGGGLGGVQLIGRVDYLSLKDNVKTGVCTGTGVCPVTTINGGSNIGYIGAVNWWPTDYVRLTFEYAHSDVTGGPNAALVVPVSTSLASDRSFGVDTFVMRTQIDF